MSLSHIRWTLLIMVSSLAVASASVVQAQGCFRGRPLPTCKTFWITEFGYGYQLKPQQPSGEATHHVTLELGAMVNLNQRSAVGGTAYFGTEFERGTRYGLKARYRYWLSRSVSLEASPGILLINTGPRSMPGFTGHVAVNLDDRLAATSSLDAFGGAESWTVGVKAGSHYGIVATGLGLAALGVALAVLSSIEN